MKVERDVKGITLVALVVTIIVLLILAGVSLSLVAGSDGILNKAGKAVDKNKISTAKEIAELVIMDVQADYYEESYAEETYIGSKTDYILGKLQSGIESSDYLVQAETGEKIKVYKGTGSTLETVASGILDENGKLIWDEEASGGVVANPTAGRNESSKNRTLANATTGYSYKNPVIPQGFKAVDIGEGVWRYKDVEKTEVRGWNEGLVIEDVYNGNQFVWVPVDGTNVVYAKNFGFDSGDERTAEDTSDDTDALPMGIIESTQIGTYQGFYVARFEAGFAGGNNTVTTNNVNTIAPVSKENVKVWNFINYHNAVVASKLMINDSTKYGKNKSGLITGTQWDTIMAWYKGAGIGVEKTTQKWGGYYDIEYRGIGSHFTFNGSSGTLGTWMNGEFSHIEKTQPYQFHGTGVNKDAIKKNIADIGGNVWEWSAEVCSSRCLHRGGSAHQNVSIYPASCRDLNASTDTYCARGFRVTLYIQ